MNDRMFNDRSPNGHDWQAYSRYASAGVAFCMLCGVYWGTGNFGDVFRLVASLCLPVLCIWLPEAMGRLTGISTGLGRPQVTQTTPALAVAIGGWVLLLAILFALVYSGFSAAKAT